MISPRAIESVPPVQRHAYSEIEKRLTLLGAALVENLRDDGRLSTIAGLLEQVREQVLLAAINRELVQRAGDDVAREERRAERMEDSEYRPLYVG